MDMEPGKTFGSKQEKFYQNYLFDLYGTLADIHTDEDMEQLWQDFSVTLALRGAYYRPQELKRRYHKGVEEMEHQARKRLGKGSWPEVDVEPVFRALYEEAGVEAEPWEVKSLAWEFRKLSVKKLRLFEGAEELLRRLKASGRRIFLLSNAQALFTRPELHLLGLEKYFDGIFLSSDIGRKKPDPAFYNKLMETFHLDPQETVMVGNDDVADCHGAARAGLDSMYIFTEQSPKPSGPLPKNCRRLSAIGEAG